MTVPPGKAELVGARILRRACTRFIAARGPHQRRIAAETLGATITTYAYALRMTETQTEEDHARARAVR